jgi:sarcosine oxidase
MMKKFQTIVIGNGLIGSAAGRYLSEWNRSTAIIGPGEPADHSTHTGVFASHYDQGRLTTELSRDPIWSPVANQAVKKYGMLEEKSGIKFHGAVGRVHASTPTPQERREMLDWLEYASEEHNIDYKYFVAGDRSWKKMFPFLDFPLEFDLFYQPGPAGYVNPRQMLLAQNAIAQQNGAELINQRVIKVDSTADGVEITTEDGEKYSAEKVLVSCGAFTNFSNLLPEPIPLRFKTESMVWGTVSDQTAERLKTMPGVGYDIKDPDLDDPYMAPPILYPDGTYKIKMGCNTKNELWPADLEEMQAWFQSGRSDDDLPAMERALRSQLPDVEFLAFTSHRCIVTYTPSGYPTIDAVPSDPHGRLFVATGGNGTGAQGSDTLGHAAAGLMHDGRWIDALDRNVFLASNSWGAADKKLTKAQERAMALAKGK